MPRAASTCCAALVLGAVQARGPNCNPAAQARPDATWPRDDGGSRRPYAARSHCRVPSDVAPRLEAWLDAILERRCPQSYFRQWSPATTPRCAAPANATCTDGRPVEATLRSLRDVAGPCADEVREQLTEEYLGWWGFCDWDKYVIPPLTGVADPKRGPYDVAYFIVAYRDAAFLERQFRALYDARNLYVYHVDVRVGKDVVDRLRALERAHANVLVSRCGTVVYRTDSASWLVYRFMAWLVEHDVKFGHAVPLDGGAYPLVGPKRMRALLAADDGSAWVGAWACAKAPQESIVARRKTNGFVTLSTCAGNAALHTSDVRVCFKRAVGADLSDPADGAGCSLITPPPGASPESGHRRTIEDIARHWRKSFTGNSAIYSERTVRALVASPSVKRLHAFFKYGYLAIEEHFWAIALDMVAESDGDAACPRARKGPTQTRPEEVLEHADREYFGHLGFNSPRAFDWRRGAVFQTWHYDSVCPDPEAKLAASLARKLDALREQLRSAERRAAAAEASGRRAENPIRKQLVVGRATAARAEAGQIREAYFRTKSELKAARAPAARPAARRSGKKPTNSPKNLVLDWSSRNCGGAWAKGDARKAPVLEIFRRDRGAKLLFARKFDSTSSGLLDAVGALIAEDV